MTQKIICDLIYHDWFILTADSIILVGKNFNRLIPNIDVSGWRGIERVETNESYTKRIV